MNDKEYIEAIHSHNEQKITVLYKELRDSFYGFIGSSYKGSGINLNEIYQESFLKMCCNVWDGKLTSLKSKSNPIQSCTLSTYLNAIGRNTCNEHLRKKGNYVFVDTDDLLKLVENCNPFEERFQDEARKERLDAVRDVVFNKLKYPCDKIFQLRFWGSGSGETRGLSHKEIADKMGYASEAVAKVQFADCKKKVQNYLHFIKKKYSIWTSWKRIFAGQLRKKTCAE